MHGSLKVSENILALSDGGVRKDVMVVNVLCDRGAI